MNNERYKDRWFYKYMKDLPEKGSDIEELSHEIIEQGLNIEVREIDKPVVKRMVHAAGDISFAECIEIHKEAVEAGISAIRSNCPIICDVRMAMTGITRLDNELECFISDQEVISTAKENNSTRAAEAVSFAKDKINNAIFVVGNAPTAIWRLLELYDNKEIEPALVVGTPVGFVGAAESKKALIESGMRYISNTDSRGGSPIAAAAVNALAIMSKNAN
ncbi:MAG: precorrin-8X methylmutase [Planctomycetota bacterium]|jgi:precorrin-8X/cobalt-precorrin-8 methylmutase